MTTQRTAWTAVWTSLSLLTPSACAHEVWGGFDDESSDEAVSGGGGGGGGGTLTSDGSEHSASGTASGTGAGSSTGSSNGEAGCNPDEHFCGGVCTANTPGTGCSQSGSCDPCTAPAHGTSTCTAMGTCDFTCAAGYNEVDGQCQCASECCTDSDCTGGNVCSSGTCGPPPCYFQDCFVSCLIGLKCGGICVATTCTCLPCQ